MVKISGLAKYLIEPLADQPTAIQPFYRDLNGLNRTQLATMASLEEFEERYRLRRERVRSRQRAAQP
jgi:hypothetical protein